MPGTGGYERDYLRSQTEKYNIWFIRKLVLSQHKLHHNTNSTSTVIEFANKNKKGKTHFSGAKLYKFMLLRKILYERSFLLGFFHLHAYIFAQFYMGILAYFHTNIIAYMHI